MRPDRASVLKSYVRTSETDHWESVANSGLDAAERRAVQSTIPRGRGQLLVVGSGTGRDTLEFARLGHKVVGLDLARELVIKAAARSRGQQLDAGFVVADATQVPFRTGCFDCVLMLAQVIGHIPGQAGHRKALAEAARITPVEGRILVSVYDGSFKEYPTLYLLWRLVRRIAPGNNRSSPGPSGPSLGHSSMRIQF